MATVLVTCSACENDIELALEKAILRVDIELTPRAELLYCCTACEAPRVQTITGDLLTQLLLAGVHPVALGEPVLDACDRAPKRPVFTRDDLLAWHEQLANVWFVTPWQ
jgi:hypothetical protein